MLLTFQKTYRCALDSIHIATYNAGDQIDIDPEGPMKDFIPGILEGEFAIESKPDHIYEVKADADTEVIENPKLKKKR